MRTSPELRVRGLNGNAVVKGGVVTVCGSGVRDGEQRETSGECCEVLRERGAAYSLRLAERQRMGSRMSD